MTLTLLAVLWLFSPLFILCAVTAVVERFPRLTDAFDHMCDRIDAWSDRVLG